MYHCKFVSLFNLMFLWPFLLVLLYFNVLKNSILDKYRHFTKVIIIIIIIIIIWLKYFAIDENIDTILAYISRFVSKVFHINIIQY